ncbi:hypothetical protein [Microcoleus sp. PH2017_01_SCD_O_A]|nr:hypothetical protein [Microcoleus sp. PH2017_01_SCD_O_A]
MAKIDLEGFANLVIYVDRSAFTFHTAPGRSHDSRSAYQCI